VVIEAYIMAGPIERNILENEHKESVGRDRSTKLFKKHKVEPISTNQHDSFR